MDKNYTKVRHFHPGMGSVRVDYHLGDSVAWVTTTVLSAKDKFNRKVAFANLEDRAHHQYSVPIPAKFDGAPLNRATVNEFLDSTMEVFSIIFTEVEWDIYD